MHGHKDKPGIPATFDIIYFIGWKPHPDHVGYLTIFSSFLVFYMGIFTTKCLVPTAKTGEARFRSGVTERP